MNWSIDFESNSAHVHQDADAALSTAQVPDDINGYLEPLIRKIVNLVPQLAALLDEGSTKDYSVVLGGDGSSSISIEIRARPPEAELQSLAETAAPAAPSPFITNHRAWDEAMDAAFDSPAEVMAPRGRYESVERKDERLLRNNAQSAPQKKGSFANLSDERLSWLEEQVERERARRYEVADPGSDVTDEDRAALLAELNEPDVEMSAGAYYDAYVAENEQ